MMKVFLVFKQGVYRHECGGVFSTFELARDAARKLIAGERDDYHTYKVSQFELDAISGQTDVSYMAGIGGETFTSGGNVLEPAVILTLSRKDEEVTETLSSTGDDTH